MAQDGFDKLAGTDLKAPIEIAFIDQFGQEEYVVSLDVFMLILVTDVVFAIGPALMVEESSRSFSRCFVERCLILIGGCGWPTRRTSCTRIHTCMPLNVSRRSTPPSV
jgi:hypothetical protein